MMTILCNFAVRSCLVSALAWPVLAQAPAPDEAIIVRKQDLVSLLGKIDRLDQILVAQEKEIARLRLLNGGCL